MSLPFERRGVSPPVFYQQADAAPVREIVKGSTPLCR
jgi:hypothetical protein